MGALIEPWRSTVTSRNTSRSVSLCHTFWLPCSGIVGIFATSVCCMEGAFGANRSTGSCSPKGHVGPVLCPITLTRSLGKRGLFVALWLLARLFHSCLPSVFGGSHCGQCESRMRGAAHIPSTRDGGDTGVRVSPGVQHPGAGRECLMDPSQSLELQAEVSQAERLV